MQRAGAAGTAPRSFFNPRARQGQRQLVRHQLIIGKPLARRMIRVQIRCALRLMRGAYGRLPIGPPLPLLLRRINPLGQVRRKFERCAGGFGHGFLRDTCCERINRFIMGQFFGLMRQEDMVRMHHLRQTIKKLDLARHQPPRAAGQFFLQILCSGMKKDQLKSAFGILYHYAVGPAARSRRLMRAHQHLNREGLR